MPPNLRTINTMMRGCLYVGDTTGVLTLQVVMHDALLPVMHCFLRYDALLPALRLHLHCSQKVESTPTCTVAKKQRVLRGYHDMLWLCRL